MPRQNNIEIASITLLSNKVLQLQFSVEWTIEDTTMLTEYLTSLTSLALVEVIQGADLQCARLKGDDYELLLNFEEYSHSCWLECISDADSQGLLRVKDLIEQL